MTKQHWNQEFEVEDFRVPGEQPAEAAKSSGWESIVAARWPEARREVTALDGGNSGRILLDDAIRVRAEEHSRRWGTSVVQRLATCFLLVSLSMVHSSSVAGPNDGGGESPLTGAFHGPYTFNGVGLDVAGGLNFPTPQRGTIRLSVAATGRITGTFNNETLGRQGVIRGFVDEDGTLEGSWGNEASTFTIKGTLTKTKLRHLKGTIILFVGEDRAVGGYRFDLAP
jgi:hypothetical protein